MNQSDTMVLSPFDSDTAIVYYRVLEHSEDGYFAIGIPTHMNRSCAIEQELIIRCCADDYCNRADALEDWIALGELTFTLHESEGGHELGRFSVEINFEPCFYPRKIQVM